MTPNTTVRTATLCLLTLGSGSALAGVNVLSRSSNVTAFQDLSPTPPPGYDPNYNESQSYTPLGAWSSTLPHGLPHSSSVTNGAASGSFRSNYYENNQLGSQGVWYARASSLAVDFKVTNRAIAARIDLDGYCILLRNAYLTILNLDTNQFVFDSIDHGVAEIAGDFEGMEMRWNAVQRSVDLSTGHYRLLIGAGYEHTFHPGPGQGQQANAHLDATVTFPCEADLNASGTVDDADFAVFAFAYNLLLCDDAAMAVGCPSDLNGDTTVDDADFQVFVHAYNAAICP